MVDFKGERRSNATHESRTDSDANLMRKGEGLPATLSLGAHALMENRSGLLVDGGITDAPLFEPKATATMRDRPCARVAEAASRARSCRCSAH